MKKSKLLLVFSCVGLLGVTACDNQAPTTSSNPPAPPVVTTESIEFADDKLVNDVLIQKNSEEKEVVENPKVKNIKITPEKESFERKNILDSSHMGNGLLVVKNDEGYVGFYSLLHHGWLIKPCYEEGKFNYSVRDLPYIGYVLEIQYRDQYVVLDAFGNVLHAGDKGYSRGLAKYYYDEEATWSQFKHIEMEEEDWSYLSTRLINDKAYLMLPLLEEEEYQEPVEDEYGYPVYEKDEDGNYVRDEDGNKIPVTEKKTKEFVTAYFVEYSSDGNCGILEDAHGWPEQEEEEEELPEGIKEFVNGDYFTGSLTDLEEYGLPGYYLVKSADGNTYTVYNGNGEVKSSFTIKSKLSNYPLIQEFGIIGEKMIFQACEQVADDSEDYDVFIRDLNPTAYNPHSGAKYVYESFTYNLLTGERKDFDTPYYFQGKVNPIIGAGNGEFLYEVTLSTVNDSRTLDAARTYLVDKDFVAHDDITGFEFYNGDEYNLQQLQDGTYFNANNKVVYDKNLKPIVHLRAIDNLQYLPEHNVFIGRYNGLYGLVGTDGKVRAEFKYTYIDTANGISGRFLAVRYDSDGDEACYLVGDGKYEVFVGSESEYHSLQLNVYGKNGLYMLTDRYDAGGDIEVRRYFFDAQSTRDMGYNLDALAQVGPNTYDRYVEYELFNRSSKAYYTEYATVGENRDYYYIYDQLLGQYTTLYVDNEENEYTIDKVAVLDQYDDPVEDMYGNPAMDEEINDNWIATFTSVRPENLKLRSYESGDELEAAFYLAKDEETAQVLSLDVNEVLRYEHGSTYLVFTPEEDGPYMFTGNPELALGALATERWEETPVVTGLWAQYGDDTQLRIDSKGKLTVTLEVEEIKSEDPEAPKTYTPAKFDFKELVLHKVYDDKNEAQKKDINSHMAISLDDVKLYEKVAKEKKDEQAEIEYEWKEIDFTDFEMDKPDETRTFKVEFALDEEETLSFEFLAKTKLKQENPAPAQQQNDEEEEEPWDPADEFNMIESEDEMVLNQKVKYHTITSKVHPERDPEDPSKKVPAYVDFYFGDDSFEDIKDDEWTNEYLHAGHDYYFTLQKSTGKQENTIEVKESHIHKVSEWVMGDLIDYTDVSVSSISGGMKFGVCENGEEVIQRPVDLYRSENLLTEDELKEFKDNLAEDLSKEYGIMLNQVVVNATYSPAYDKSYTTGSAVIYVLKGLVPEEIIEEYNKNRDEKDPELKEIEAEDMADRAEDTRLTQAGLAEFTKEDSEWTSVQMRYLFDPEQTRIEFVKDDDGNITETKVTRTKSFYAIYATKANTTFVGIYTAEGVLVYSTLREELSDLAGNSIVKTTLRLNMLYSTEFTQYIIDQYGF